MSTRENLVLETVPQQVTYPYSGDIDYKLAIAQVVLIELPDCKEKIVDQGHIGLEITHDATQNRLAVPPRFAHLLSRYARLIWDYENPPDRYTGFSFASFVLGHSNIVQDWPVSNGYSPDQSVDQQSLELGKAYVLIDRAGVVKQSVVGLGVQDPIQNLSVLGGNGPIALSDTSETMKLFGAEFAVPQRF